MATEIFPPLVLSLDPAGDRSAAALGRPDVPPLPRGGRHGFLDLDRWERGGRVAAAMERGDAAAALLSRLRGAAARCEPVAVGTLEDPYSSRRAARTRALLETCRELEGLALSLTTRSPWILRDLKLLGEIDACHTVSIEIPITAADPAVARRLEPDAVDPAERLAAVAALSAHGLATTVWCLPIVSGVNDGEETLRALFAAAREAGARDVLGSSLFFGEKRGPKPASKRGSRQEPDQDVRRLAVVAGRFARLRLEHGFPNDRAGRG